MPPRRCGLLFAALLLAVASTPRAEEAAPPPDTPPPMPPADKRPDLGKPPGDVAPVAAPPKAKGKAPPTKCHLRDGEVKDGFVLFQAEFDFRTEQPDAVIVLACGQARVRDARQQDGRTPLLASDANEYVVQVEKPGDYAVTLDLSVPLTQRPGGGRGFVLDLPRAVVNELEIALPADALAPQVNNKPLSEMGLTLRRPPPAGAPGAADTMLLSGFLGIVDHLELSWRTPPPPGVGPLRTARGRVTVRVEGDAVATEAELTLHAQGGPVAEWEVVVPPAFEVKASPNDQPRVRSITRGEEPSSYASALRTGLDLLHGLLPGWPSAEPGVPFTVVLNEPSDDDLTLKATGPRASLANGKRVSVGPFLVRGAARQWGVVLVAAGRTSGPALHPQPDLTHRTPSEEEQRPDPGLTDAYDYAAAPAAPWLEVEAGPAGGAVRTQAAYALALVRPDDWHGQPSGRDPREWQVKTTLTPSSRDGAGADHLDVLLSPDCEVVTPSLPADAQWVKDGRLLHLPLGSPTGSPVSFTARYSSDAFPAVPKDDNPLGFPLPRLASPQPGDPAPQIEVTVPEDLELTPPADAEVADPHKFTWRPAAGTDIVRFSWRPYRPEVRVSSVIDITLRCEKAEVKHELHLHFPRTVPAQLALHTPAALGPSVQAVGRTLGADPAAPETRTLPLQAAQDQDVTLQYTFPVTGDPLSVPLVSVGAAKDGDARVRVWCDAGRLPAPPGGDWSERNIEEVKDANRLPVLVLEATRPDAPLTLAFRDATGAAPAAVLVDRALYRAALKGDAWEIRASYLLRQPAGDHLDVELPDAPSALRLRATLDGLAMDPETVEQSDANGGAQHLARLRLGGGLFLKPAVLDLTYQLPARGTPWNTLTPPRLVGDPGQAPTRWQVTLPADWVALAPEGGTAERWTLGLRGWLPAPQLAVTADDLEQWFAGADAPNWPRGAATPPTLVCWQDAGRPMTVAYLPEGVWMVLCSVPLVFLGLLLYYLGRRSYGGARRAAVLFWLLTALLAPAAGAAWVFSPTLLYAIAFGCEPGAAVLLLLLLVQAALLERYRRRIVFLPNFRRARTGSSLVRANGPARPAGEPSTVDVPRPAGSAHPQAS